MTFFCWVGWNHLSGQRIAKGSYGAKRDGMKNLAWYSKVALGLTVFLPLYFGAAALGTKFGIWSWQFGLGTMIGGGGRWVVGIAALVALIVLLIGVLKTPRDKRKMAIGIVGLLVPAFFAYLGISAQGKAAANPIYDVSTDTANPPMFSDATMKMREEAGANELYDYETPIGRIEKWEGADKELAIQSHAQIITDRYASLSPLPLAGATREDAVEAVEAAMADMGFSDITSNVEEGRVEGVATTFWFGFKDDVVARIGDAQIDFRSVSRVGRSDLGANSERIADLREATQARIGQR